MTLAESEKTPERSPESAQLDEAAIRRLQDDLPDDEVLYDLAELFRVFGDSTRIKILYALFESELCVNDIAQVVGISQSAVSHQLRRFGKHPAAGPNRLRTARSQTARTGS